MAKVNNVGGYISVDDIDKTKSIKEEFQGQNLDVPLRFPKGLGAEHPFEFKDVENLYKKYGIASGIVNKWADAIVSDFEIKLKNKNAQVIIDNFVHTTDFHRVLREWVREAILKGNGFMEIDLEEQKVRVLNANNMYVKRKRTGEILEYNQWMRELKAYDKNSKDLVTFKPNQIAHLTFNKIPNEPYGYGIIIASERVIENIIKNEQDLQKIISRKAGAPYHIKVGQPGVFTPPQIVNAIKANLQYLRNTVEWVTDGDIEIKAVEFGQLGQSLLNTQEYFYRQLLGGTEMPEVLMGSGQLNEGIAKTQMDAFKLSVSAKQEQVGSIVEEQIIRPLLRANGMDEIPEFVWDLPTEDDIDKRIQKIQGLLSGMENISDTMRSALEIELAKLMGMDDVADILPSPKDVQKQEEENKKDPPEPVSPEAPKNQEAQAEQNLKQPEMPGAKPNANQSNKTEVKEQFLTESEILNMTLREWVNLKEAGNLNYTEYLTQILKNLKNENFNNLKALTESDVANGMLTSEQIDKLRLVLREGFRNNQTLGEIEREIQNKVGIKNLTLDNKTIESKNRIVNIARTETVRISNDALVDVYRNNGIKEVRFLSALSSRTCPVCESLNGQVFNLNDMDMGINKPPIHNQCRCSLVGVVE